MYVWNHTSYSGLGNVAPAPVTVTCAEAGAGAPAFAGAFDPEGALVAGDTLPAGLADELVHAVRMSASATSPAQSRRDSEPTSIRFLLCDSEQHRSQ